MSSIDWASTLALPPCVRRFERTIPTHVLLREADLTRTQREGLRKIEGLTLLGVAQESTTRIPATAAMDRRIDAVLFVRASLGKTRAFESTAALVHGCFPHPSLLIQENTRGDVCLSAALTSLRKRATGLNVDSMEVDSSIALWRRTEHGKAFLSALAFDALDQRSLTHLTEDIMARIRLARIARLVGFYPDPVVCRSSDVVELIERLLECQSRQDQLRAQWKRHATTQRERLRLRIPLSEAINQTKAAVDELTRRLGR